MVGKPNDTVLKITCLPRWQREWINNHRAINYSGLVQQMLANIIKQKDPEYYQKHHGYIEIRLVKRKEIVDQSLAEINVII